MLTGALTAAGVTLGAYDQRIVDWLAGLDGPTVAVIAGLITQAHAAGRALPSGDPEMGALAAGFPGWRIWRRSEDGVCIAWLLGSKPPHLLYADSAAGLREQLEAEDGGPDAS